ncbi:MAG: transporter related protein [Bacilli bacterium]|nr:transporter related protein [Bacilli bacterium]
MSNIVTFNHVSKKFSGRVALTDVSFNLPSGKIIGIIGPNGSGKSTLLKLIAGLLRPSRGNVLLNGASVERRSSAKIAYLPEQDGCYPFYTVAETIQFHQNIFADFNHHKAMEMIDFMKLDRKQKVGSLSKGNLTRFKMVTALSRRAPLILLDEPLSGLDPMIRESIIQGLITFVDLSEQTVMMTTHEIIEMEPVLDMVVAMNQGEMICIDEVDNIRSEHGKSLMDWMKKIYRV